MRKNKKSTHDRIPAAVIILITTITFVAVFILMSISADFIPISPVYNQTTTTSEEAPVVNTLEITGEYIISEDRELPSDTEIYVRKGGTLYISNQAEVTLSGTLEIAEGGAVFINGTLISAKGSEISDSGEMNISQNGIFSLGGELFVNESGIVSGEGTLELLNDFTDIVCTGTVTARIKAPTPLQTNGVTTIGGIVIANREFSLPKNYGSGLDSDAYSAFLEMKSASGYDMTIISGFRSYEKQQDTFEYWASIDGYEKADTYSAQAGHSDHQTGLALDISSLKQNYGETDEGRWLARHCSEYGFVLRYPKGCEEITGYIYEPWHIRYVGKSTAKLIYDSGLALEQFLGIPANYKIDEQYQEDITNIEEYEIVCMD